MAGIVAQGNDLYIGELILDAKDGVKNGSFVTANFEKGTATPVKDAADGDGDIFFVVNVIDTVPEQGIDDVDFVVKNGKYLRLHYPQKGEILITTEYSNTFAKGAELAVIADGFEPIGTRTPKIKFKVKDVTTAFGKSALELVVL